MQRELKVPICSEDIADMTDRMLAEMMQRLSIKDVPIYEINWGNKRFTNPWKTCLYTTKEGNMTISDK